MTIAGIGLLGLGLGWAVWVGLKGLTELAMIGAVVGAVGAGLLWGWPAGLAVGAVGNGLLLLHSWRRFRG